METGVETLIRDLLGWVTKHDRTYEEVIEAWHTSCPRLPVWEEVNDRGLVVRENLNGRCVVHWEPAVRLSVRIYERQATMPVEH